MTYRKSTLTQHCLSMSTDTRPYSLDACPLFLQSGVERAAARSLLSPGGEGIVVKRRSGLHKVPFAVAMVATVGLLVGPSASSAPSPYTLDHFSIASVGDQTAGAG